ncbi:GPGG-motif small membrane protein, partial [Microbispora hainanensis]|uniref:GPGG-motif small membrane protein n=1 Tax=Microbispora hainanensis TaxID=568844 RepID=UPI0033E4CB67
MATLLWIIAVVLVIAGIYVILARRDILWGIVLIVLGFLPAIGELREIARGAHPPILTERGLAAAVTSTAQ